MCIAVILIILIHASHITRKMATEAAEEMQAEFHELHDVHEFLINLYREHAFAVRYISAYNHTEGEQCLEGKEALSEENEVLLECLNEHFQGEGEYLDEFGQIMLDFEIMNESFETWSELRAEGLPYENKTQFICRFSHQLNNITMGAGPDDQRGLDFIAANVMAEIERAEEAYYSAEAIDRLVSISGILVAIVISVVLGVAIARSISKPIENMTEATESIRNGNLDVKVEEAGTDEIERLANAFNAMAEDLKDYKSAVEQFQFVKRAIPRSYVMYDTLGSVMLATGDINAAIANYETAIGIKPTCGDAHYYLGRIYQQRGEVKKAVKHYSRAIRFLPNYVLAYNNLADVFYRQGKIDEAVEVCRRGVMFIPDSSLLHCSLGILLYKQGHRDSAIEELKISLELDPNSIQSRTVLESLLKNAPK